MSKNVKTVSPETNFRKLGEIIFGKPESKKYPSTPVVDNKGKLLGIVTQEDIIRKLYPSQKELIENFFEVSNFQKMEEGIHEIENLSAKDLMHEIPHTTTLDTPILQAGSLMLVHHLRRLMVVNDNGILIGIITMGDIFRAMCNHLKKNHHKIH